MFNIGVHHSTIWQKLDSMNAGFDCLIQIEQLRTVPSFKMRHPTIIRAEELGITSDFELTPKLYLLSQLH
jgi:hypothetical protein